MMYLYSFIFCGVVCVIGQVILDNSKLTPGHLTSLFVVIGAGLDIFNIYDKFIEWFGAGTLVPITSFGHLLVHGALAQAHDLGNLGLLLGMFDLTTAGIVASIIVSFVLAILFKPKS